jgi:hypothetical protein
VYVLAVESRVATIGIIYKYTRDVIDYLPGENQESLGNLWFLSLGAVTVLSVPKKSANHHVPNDLSDD